MALACTMLVRLCRAVAMAPWPVHRWCMAKAKTSTKLEDTWNLMGTSFKMESALYFSEL